MALITISWLLDGILILTASIMAFYLYMNYNFNYWKKRNFKQVSPAPIFGNFADPFFQRKSFGQLLKVIYDGSQGLSCIGFYIFNKPCLLIRDKKLVKEILIKDFDHFTDHYATPDNKHDRLASSNLFFIKNPAWKMLRTKLTPFFTTAKIKKMFNLILEVGEEMDTYLTSLKLDSKGQTVDVKDIASRYTIDMIASIAYGLKINSLNNPDSEFPQHGRNIFGYGVIGGFTWLAAFCMPYLVSLARLKLFGESSCHFLRDLLWQTINHRLESKEKRGDLIDMLIELRNTYSHEEINGFKFDGDDLLAQAVVFFNAGFETTSSTISFALYELAIRPEIQDRVRREIMDTLEASDGEITYEIVKSMSYLDMVVAEAMRMYPILTFLDRVAIDNYKIPNSDLIIEKGTPIFISLMGMHFDPQYFPDPLRFDPERFNDENKSNRASMVYLPFGEGPRACIGSRLGFLQVKLALLKIFTHCEVTLCEKTQVPVMIRPRGITISPLNGSIYLNIKKY